MCIVIVEYFLSNRHEKHVNIIHNIAYINKLPLTAVYYYYTQFLTEFYPLNFVNIKLFAIQIGFVKVQNIK